MQTLLRDVVFGARMLIRQPLFSVVAVSLLALAIGASTAIFSVVDAVLLRALPYRDGDRLVVLDALGANGKREMLSIAELETFRERTQTLEKLATATTQSVTLTGGESPARVRGSFVSANFFDVLQIAPIVGRTFATGEDRAGAAPVAIVSERLWVERLKSDSQLADARLSFNSEPHRIVGVVPSHFEQPFEVELVDVWLPVSRFEGSPHIRYFYGLGYLESARSLSEARAEAATIAGQLAASDPAVHAGRTATVEFLRELTVARSRPLLGALSVAVAVILAIACANLGHLLLARGVARRREFSIRAALGATRRQLVRQLLTEATLLGLVGGGLGLLLSHWGVAGLLALPQNFAAIEDVALDGRVLLFALTLSLLTAWFFGLTPALQLSKLDHWLGLREDGRSGGDGRRANRVRGAFVVVQVSLSLLLLVGAALLLRSFDALLAVDVGFERHRVLTLEYRLSPKEYSEPSAQVDAHQRIVEQIAAVPGVESVALVDGLPFSGNRQSVTVAIPGMSPPPVGQERKIQLQSVSSNYFETLGIRFMQGRLFDGGDRLGAPLVLIVNQTMARTFWPDGSAIGKSIQVLEDDIQATVVGVVADARHVRLEEEPSPQAYAPVSQRPDRFVTVAIRTALEPLALVEPVRRAIWRAEPDQAMWKIRTLESLVERSLANRKFLATLIGVFAAVALLLTWVGLYGVIRYLVARRTREIGIRMALGAKREDVVRLLLRQGMKLVAAGLVIGLASAWATTRFISHLLFGVSPTDAPTFLGIAASLAAVACLACYLPARRATRVDPMLALRHE